MAIRLSTAQMRVVTKILRASLNETGLSKREVRSVQIALYKITHERELAEIRRERRAERQLRETLAVDGANWRPGDPIYPRGT